MAEADIRGGWIRVYAEDQRRQQSAAERKIEQLDLMAENKRTDSLRPPDDDFGEADDHHYFAHPGEAYR